MSSFIYKFKYDNLLDKSSREYQHLSYILGLCNILENVKDVADRSNLDTNDIRNLLTISYHIGVIKKDDLSKCFLDSIKCDLFSKERLSRIVNQISKKKSLSNQDNSRNIERHKRLLRVYDLYRSYETLEKVGEKMNVTRERVRQLLKQGDKLGLFKYTTNSKNNKKDLVLEITKEMIVEVISDCPNNKELADKLNIKISELNYLLDFYDIDSNSYYTVYNDRKLLEQYCSIVDELGRHPSTTEMSRKINWRYLWTKISKRYKSFDNFRNEYGIEKPEFRIHPNTLEGFKRGHEKRGKQKNENMDKIVNYIKNNDRCNSKEIRDHFSFKSSTNAQYIKRLVDSGSVYKIVNRDNRVYYTSNKDNISAFITKKPNINEAIVDVLKKENCKAKKIADIIGTTRKQVNKYLYSELNKTVIRDDNYYWSLKQDQEISNEVNQDIIRDYISKKFRDKETLYFYYKDDIKPRFVYDYNYDNKYIRVTTKSGFEIKYLISKIAKMAD